MKKFADVILTVIYYAFKYLFLLLGFCFSIIGGIFKFVANRLSLKLPAQGEETTLDSLPELTIASNWKTPPVELPRLLIYDGGAELDAIAQNFVDEFVKVKSEDQVVAVAKEMTNRRGESRPLRIAQELQRGHVVATDIVLRREGKDLYVNFGIKARTLLTYLRWAWLGLFFVVAVAGILWGYLKVTGARESWVKDYAEKNTPLIYPETDATTTAFVTLRTLEGYFTTDWEKFSEQYSRDEKLMNTIEGHLRENTNIFFDSRANVLCAFKQFQPQIYFNISYLSCNTKEYYYTTYDRTRVYMTDPNSNPLGPSSFRFSFNMPLDECGNVLIKTDWVKEANLNERFSDFFVNSGDPETEKIMEVFNACTEEHPPMSLLQLLKKDPRAALFNFSMPLTIIMGAVGFFIWKRSQPSWLHFPCRLLHWIYPDDYNNRAISSMASLKRVFIESLPSDLQFDELKGNMG